MSTITKELHVKEALEKYLSDEQYDNFLENDHLKKVLFDCPNLAKFNWEIFKTLLSNKNKPKPIPWTPVANYSGIIMARSKLCGWGLSKLDELDFNSNLQNHTSRLMPTSVRISLKKGPEFTLIEVMTWLQEEMVNHKTFFGLDKLKFLSDSKHRSECRLNSVKLDLATFFDPVNGISPWDILSEQPMSIWADIEVALLLILNKQVFDLMDGVNFPFLRVPGLVVEPIRSMPCFTHDEKGTYTIHDWKDGRKCRYSSMVAYATA